MKTRTLFVLPRETYVPNYIPNFPVGPLYVSAYLKNDGFNVISLNMNMRPGTAANILKEYIKEYDINVVAVGGLSNNFHHISEVVTLSKKIRSDIIAIVGGGLMTGDPESVMEGIEGIDYGVIGEGELTCAELLHKLESAERIETMELQDVKGLIYRQGEKLIRTPHRKDIYDINNLPFPDYDAFEFFEYIEKLGIKVDGLPVRSGLITTARSCSNRCTFCSTSGGLSYRQRSMDSIFSEIDMLVKKYRITMLCLNDELFADNNERIIEFCDRIVSYGLKWVISLRVGKLNEDTISLMKRSGCIFIGVGTESMDDSVLKSMRKNITASQIEETLLMIKKSGVSCQTNFIFGDPAETLETAENTLAWWLEHQEYDINMFPIVLYPGSKLYKDACKARKISNPLEHIEKGCPLINVSQMTDREYNDLLGKIGELMDWRFKESYPHTIKNDGHLGGKLVYKCENCGSENESVVSAMASRWEYCRNCGHSHKINFLINQKELIRSGFNSLKGKIAIWGCGRLTMTLFDDILTPEDIEKLTLIDNSESKQGLKIKGLTINPSTVLKDRNISTVIFMAQSSHFPNVESTIRNKYPHVNHIVDGNDILKFFMKIVKE